jgi:hypothetical protein
MKEEESKKLEDAFQKKIERQAINKEFVRSPVVIDVLFS